MFSRSCEYAIRACIFLAQECGESNRKSIGEIAEFTDTPMAFMAKISQSLVKAGILQSKKGPKGGFFIDEKRCGNISLAEIVLAIDGNKVMSGCGLGLSECDANNPCPVHDSFLEIRNQLSKMLEETTLQYLTTDLQGKLVFKR